MKINIIGGGPAGLYSAILLKKMDPGHEIRLVERDGPDDTYGWGIVFSDRTFSYLKEADSETFDEFTRACETWENVDVVHHDQKISIGGNRFSGVARIDFLNILQRRCRDLGIQLDFHCNVTELDPLLDCDLMIGADGANSMLRRQYSQFFEPAEELRQNKYIWLGTHHLFNGLTLTFKQHEAGVFVAHSYRFNQTTSTFIVECVGDTWERAGFAGMSDQQTCEYLSRVFVRDLNGKSLLSNDFVRWFNFLLVRNRRWFHDNIVLLGDALHTAHFSIGSGTKLALEDAISLADALKQTGRVDQGLIEFQKNRKPKVDALQDAAYESLLWLEQVDQELHLDPVTLAYRLMTRSGRIDYQKLQKRDPEFVAAYERQQSG